MPTRKGDTVLPCVGLEFDYDLEIKDLIKDKLRLFREFNEQFDVPPVNVGGWHMNLKIWWCHEKVWPAMQKNIETYIKDNKADWELSEQECTTADVSERYYEHFYISSDTADEYYDDIKDDAEKIKDFCKSLLSHTRPKHLKLDSLTVDEIEALATFQLSIPLSRADLETAYKDRLGEMEVLHQKCLGLLREEVDDE